MSMHEPVCLRRPALNRVCPLALAARGVLNLALRRVDAAASLPDGGRLGRADAPVLIEIVRPNDAFERMGHQPRIGVGESYMAGDWRAAPGVDLAEAMLPFARQLVEPQPPLVAGAKRALRRAMPRQTRNTISQARRNIEAHYDLSNEMFATFLDETLTYSSACFDPATPASGQSLAVAQRRKVEQILDLADVGAGTELLEIGTGWGTLAIAAAERGAQVTTLTISPAQAELARARIAAAGFDDRITVELRDYREQTGSFDAVVSVEMIEAVGEEFWPDWFAAIDRCLRPGGRAAVQSILMSEERFAVTRDSYGWIQKHIFPGGIIPSVGALTAAAQGTGLRPRLVRSFGADYAETLRRWRASFRADADTVRSLGFDDIFIRRWEFYLAYCEAGFDADAITVGHLMLERTRAL